MAIIGAASGWGSQNPGAEAGPDYLRRRGLVDRLRAADIDAHWHATVTTKAPRRTIAKMTREQSFPLVVEHNKRLARTLVRTVNGGHLPVVVGGDHAIAIGTWSAMTAALGAEGEFGLIWIDAHMDAHTPETADQGKWGGYYHGRPLACLLARLRQLGTLGGDNTLIFNDRTIKGRHYTARPGVLKRDLKTEASARFCFGNVRWS